MKLLRMYKNNWEPNNHYLVHQLTENKFLFLASNTDNKIELSIHTTTNIQLIADWIPLLNYEDIVNM